MSDLTQLDYSSLKEFEEQLNAFLTKVSHHCDKMESGITYSRTYMKDESSAQILRKSNDVVNRIRDCIAPAKKIDEKVFDILGELDHLTI